MTIDYLGFRLYSISKDSILCHGVCMIVVDGKCLEGVGVEPDIVVPFDVRFIAGRDLRLERAKDEMVKVIEASHLSLWENHKRVTTSCIKGFLLKCVINDTQWVTHDTVKPLVAVCHPLPLLHLFSAMIITYRNFHSKTLFGTLFANMNDKTA